MVPSPSTICGESDFRLSQTGCSVEVEHAGNCVTGPTSTPLPPTLYLDPLVPCRQLAGSGHQLHRRKPSRPCGPGTQDGQVDRRRSRHQTCQVHDPGVRAAPATAHAVYTDFSHRITSAPSGLSCTTTATSVEVSGLRNGTQYTCSAVTRSALSTSAASAPSAPITAYQVMIGNGRISCAELPRPVAPSAVWRRGRIGSASQPSTRPGARRTAPGRRWRGSGKP